MQLVGVARGTAKTALHLLDRLRVEQVAQLLLAEQLAQELAVERERLGAALGRRRVVLVHVGGDVLEDERAGERRGGHRLDLDQIELARLQPLEDLLQRRQVEDVLQAFAVGLEHDRKGRVAPRDLEQALRLQSLLPERRALAGAAARDQKRPGRVLAEAGAEERALSDLVHDQLLDLVGPDEKLVQRGRLVDVGKVKRDAVVRPDGVRLDAERIAQARPERERPGCVHARPERRQHDHAPVADLVPEALDHDRLVGGESAGHLGLVVQIGEQVLGRPLVEAELAAQALQRRLVRQRDQLARGPPDRLAQLDRPAHSLALPERHRARYARRRRDEHAVARDLLDPPARGAEQEDLPLPGLVDHLLVQLAHPAAAVDEMDAVEAAIGDGAGVGHGEALRPGAPANDARRPVPDDARPQLGELVRRVAPGEHVEHVLELGARELGEGVGAADQLVQLGDADLLLGADRHDLLAEHVERVARNLRLLDQPLAHAAGHDRGLEQVAAELGEDAALGRGLERVPGAADSLQAARHRLRRLDLDDEIDRAHVDAQLERGGGDQAAQLAALERLLDLGALLARERAVVGARQLLLPGLVDAQRQALGQPAVVDEDDGRAVSAHQLDDLRIDRGPDRARLAELAHVGQRHADGEVELLARAGVDDLDRAAARDEAPDLLQRPLRGREADALYRPADQALQTLEREGEMRPALRPGDGMNLVEDQRLERSQRFPRAGGEEQEERLGRGDEDVRRIAQHRRPLFRGRVSGADGDAEPGAEPRQRSAQVALDVVVERLQRRDIEQAQSLARRLVQPVDAGEEGGERLARAGRRLDEHVLPARDRRPAQHLSRRRRGEAALEPGPCLFRERGERVHPSG